MFLTGNQNRACAQGQIKCGFLISPESDVCDPSFASSAHGGVLTCSVVI